MFPKIQPPRNTERVLNNAGVERLLEKERQKGRNLKIDDIRDEVAGVYPKVGETDAGRRLELRHGRRGYL